MLRQDGHAYTIQFRFRIRVHVVRDRGKELSFALLASKQTQHAVDVINTMLFKCDKKCKLLSTVTRLFYSVQTRPVVYALITILPRALGTEVFFAVGPISTLGLVGDSGRTVRSLSAASKPHIYPTHDAVTPSIQEEGAEHIFRVHEFQFLLGKICVAHSVDHSFTLLL